VKLPFDIADRLEGKHLSRWARGYAQHLAGRAVQRTYRGTRHLLFALCDHYEPLWGGADDVLGQQRVRAWEESYPRITARYRDADGRPPQHSFFFPGEQYAPVYLEALARLARAGFGEVELHLHHDGDDVVTLRNSLRQYLELFAQHGHLSRDSDGRLRYAFIHGNWCLANSRKDGRYCGVDAELPLLWETGCYADFTFPSFPDESQPARVNQIYWPVGDIARRRAYEHGEGARVGKRFDDRILLIQGPSSIAPRRGRLARFEAGDIHGQDLPDRDRVRSWVRQNVHVAGRPEWVFVKVHTHGAPEKNSVGLLGGGLEALYGELVHSYNDGQRYVLHHVTAREMYNIAMAAMDGKSGDPAQYRDYLLQPPPVCR
jgi:hypothetical protein